LDELFRNASVLENKKLPSFASSFVCSEQFPRHAVSSRRRTFYFPGGICPSRGNKTVRNRNTYFVSETSESSPNKTAAPFWIFCHVCPYTSRLSWWIFLLSSFQVEGGYDLTSFYRSDTIQSFIRFRIVSSLYHNMVLRENWLRFSVQLRI